MGFYSLAYIYTILDLTILVAHEQDIHWLVLQLHIPISGGGYHKPSALHSTDPIRVAKYSLECLFSKSARTQPQKLMGQL